MRIGILTNEFPPHVYGGAGVHVEYLTRELAAIDGGRHQVRIISFGDQRVETPNTTVHGVEPAVTLEAQDPRHAKFFGTMIQDLMMAGRMHDVDVVHCHTWYAHFAGCLVKQLQQVPLVLTTHSLEPHRPWKVEQLGTAYHASSWIERTAYENADGVVAVSKAMKHDVESLYGVGPERVKVIHNGIDLAQYRPTPAPAVLAEFRIDPDVPFVLFVGRITRQKGIIHLVNAIQHVRPGTQVVLCAGAPDTPEIAREMAEAVERAPRAQPQPDHLDSRDGDQGEGHRALHARGHLRVPVGVRAVRHHQPRGDGVRDACGGVGGRRDPRSGRARRDGAARAHRRRGRRQRRAA